jgi:hypothetical protein
MPIGRIKHLTNGSGIVEMLPGDWCVPFLTRDCLEKIAIGDIVECSYGFGDGGELAGKVIAIDIHLTNEGK